jgi:hypothetical protein
MTEYCNKDCPETSVRREELAEASDPLYANCRHPLLRIRGKRSARG